MSMTKIFHWVFGSFFRTLGRILGYLIIGVILALILSKAKLPKISDIITDIAFMKVNAAEVTFDVTYDSTSLHRFTWSGSTDSQYEVYKYKLINDSSSVFREENFVFQTNISSSLGDFVLIPFMVSKGSLNSAVNTVTNYYCDTWSYTKWGDEHSEQEWYCSDTSYHTDIIKSIASTQSLQANNIVTSISYSDNSFAYCSITTGGILCPLNKDAKKIVFNYSTYGSPSSGDDFYLVVYQYFSFYKYRDNGSQAIINSQNTNTNSIINNQNQNNQAVINNQNANTNATIENQNQNTQDTINSQMVCNLYDKNSVKETGLLNSSGNIVSSYTQYGVTDYIKISTTSEINVLVDYSSADSANFCTYNINKTLIRCYTLNQLSTFNITDDTSYIRSSIWVNQNKPQFKICTNGNQAMANTITDESGPSNISSLSNDNMVGWLPPGPVDSLINLPLVLLNSLQNALSSSCSPITLTLPFVNSDIVLPCMSTLYESMGVSSFVNWAGIVASAFILFSYLMRFYKWVDNTLTFRENNWLDNWGGE